MSVTRDCQEYHYSTSVLSEAGYCFLILLIFFKYCPKCLPRVISLDIIEDSLSDSASLLGLLNLNFALELNQLFHLSVFLTHLCHVRDCTNISKSNEQSSVS